MEGSRQQANEVQLGLTPAQVHSSRIRGAAYGCTGCALCTQWYGLLYWWCLRRCLASRAVGYVLDGGV